MTIKNIYGNQMVPPLAGTQSAKKAQPTKPGQMPASDRVDFSAVLQGVNKAREASSLNATERTEKIAAIKAQIASGNYRPDSEKVAESLLRFLREDV